MLFRKWGCLVGPENSIFRKLKSVDPKKMPSTTEVILHFYFPFKVFPENFTERERARARARACTVWQSPANSELQSTPIAISLANIPVAVDHDLVKRRSRDRVCRRERKIRDRDWRFARSRRRSRSREDSDLAFARSRRRSRSREEGEIAITPSIAISDRNRRRGRRTGSGLWLVFFWICVFLLLFQTPENIFRKIFWNATKNMETFSFSGN